MAGVHTRALTAPRPIKPTSPRCPSAWQPNPGRGSTYRRGKTVQTTGTTSAFVYDLLPPPSVLRNGNPTSTNSDRAIVEGKVVVLLLVAIGLASYWIAS